MGMVAILFNGAEPIKQIVNILLTEDSHVNSVKIAQAVSEKKLKNYTILYMYIIQELGQISLPLVDKILIVAKKNYYFNHKF